MASQLSHLYDQEEYTERNQTSTPKVPYEDPDSDSDSKVSSRRSDDMGEGRERSCKNS